MVKLRQVRWYHVVVWMVLLNNLEFKNYLVIMVINRIEIEEAEAGDIVAVAGLADISVGETLCEIGKEDPFQNFI